MRRARVRGHVIRGEHLKLTKVSRFCDGIGHSFELSQKICELSRLQRLDYS